MRLFAFLLFSLTLGAQAPVIQLTFDSSEAEAALAIVALHAAGKPVSDEAWARLQDAEPYRRLHAREAAMKRAFSDEDFRGFLRSPDLAAKAPALQSTLEAWRKVDLASLAARITPYLPAGATIRASVYPMVKPRTNTFVWEVRTRPAVFLYLDPALSAAEFENTVAHELHHLGFSSFADAQEARLRDLPEAPRKAAEWMGALGEGFAMLAAAGGPGVHPHAASSAATRARWDADLAQHNANLRKVEAFFLGILQNRFATPEALQEAGFSFFGEQGPWYTVGYRMAVLVERHQGRAALLACMVDPRKLLAAYNAAAKAEHARGGEPLALWSESLIAAVDPPERQSP